MRQQALAKLAGQPEDCEARGSLADAFMFQEYYRDRAPDYLGKEFGPQFALAVAKLPPGSWQGPIESGFGWHLVFVDTVIPGRVPAFEEIEPDVKTAWLGDAEGAGLGEGVQGHAREVHRAAARAARGARRRPVTHRAHRARPAREAALAYASACSRPGCCWRCCSLPCAASGPRGAPAYLEIKETAPGQFSVLWRTPVLAGMRLPVVAEASGRCAEPEGARCPGAGGFARRTALGRRRAERAGGQAHRVRRACN